MQKTDHIAILGYGLEGQSIVQYLFKSGYKNLEIRDSKPDIDVNIDVQKLCGKRYLDDLEKFDHIFKSPGIPLTHKKLEAVIDKITSSTSLFFEKCPAKIIGVTGTKGKGTTSTLIHKMLEESGKKSWLGGNIGVPPLSFLDDIQNNDWVVLELSSFQLQDLKSSPHIAVVLMVTQEHLDLHKDINEYRDAKKNILNHQKGDDIAIINTMYPSSKEYVECTKGRVFHINCSKMCKSGGYVENNIFILVKDDKRYKVCPVSKAKLRGKHNWENILAATTAAFNAGANLGSIAKVIQSFEGLPHRLEKVHQSEGITYINDTFSTAPEPTIAAIKAFDEPTILILGGSEKGHDYKELAKEIIKRRNISKVIFLGNTASRLMRVEIERENNAATERVNRLISEGRTDINIYRDIPLKMAEANSMQEAVLSAKIDAEPGSIVLLSPAAASFDLFNNYKERGKIFTELARKQ